MQITLNSRSRRGSNISAWFFAALSVFMLATPSYFITMEFEKIRMQQQLEAKEIEIQLSERKVLVSEIAGIMAPQGLARFATGAAYNTTLQILQKISLQLAAQDYTQAALLTEELTKSSGGELAKYLANFQSLLQRAAKLNDDKVKLNAEIAAANKEHEELSKSYALLQRELNSFFGLSSKQDNGMAFYQSGILQGLPLLNGLPDQIEDIISLVQQIENANGKVIFPPNVKEEEQRAYFDERMEDARDRSFNISLRHEELQKQIKEKNSLLDTTAAELSETGQETDRALVRATLIYSRHSIDL